VRSQIEHGLREAEYGYWGFSPANVPEGGYQEYGVDAIGMNLDGYASNTDRTYVSEGGPLPAASAYTNGVVTRTPPSWRWRTHRTRPSPTSGASPLTSARTTRGWASATR
jgi:hypothetical protein